MYHKIDNIYSEHAISDLMIRRWVPFLLDEGLVQHRYLQEKIELTIHRFPQISHSLLHKIVSEKMQYQRLCAHLVLKMLGNNKK